MTHQQSTFESYFFRLLFKLKLYEASGTSFQSLVSQIFEWAVPGFQKIAPWGNLGDGGNDGWVQLTGHYYQVYGPLSTSDITPVTGAKKTKDDFQKLLRSWPDVRQYSFVLNDRFEGIPAPIPQVLAEIKTTYDLEHTGTIGAGELAAIFSDLAYDQKLMITGSCPPQQPGFIDARAVGELLTHLADKPSRRIGMLRGLPPDFEQKIQFNGLTESTAAFLRTANYQVAHVDEFLTARGPGLQQAIAEEIHQMYLDSKSAIPDIDADFADLRFIWLSQKLIPESAKVHPHTEKAYIDAAYTILSKYFETCDAYDNPDSNHTT